MFIEETSRAIKPSKIFASQADNFVGKFRNVFENRKLFAASKSDNFVGKFRDVFDNRKLFAASQADNFVGKFRDGQSVCRNYNCPPRRKTFYQRQNLSFSGRVQARCRFVEQNYRSVFQKCANQSEPLQLPATEFLRQI